MARCLYHSSFQNFMKADNNSIFGTLCENYHGEALTTTRDAWLGEISTLKNVLRGFDDNGEIVFEYDIPRLGKRVDVVLLLKGIIFCLEFNAYRVLLTRARMGMVICVPYGNSNKNVSGFWEDSTRLPEYYNGTYEYLKSLGIEEI